MSDDPLHPAPPSLRSPRVSDDPLHPAPPSLRSPRGLTSDDPLHPAPPSLRSPLARVGECICATDDFAYLLGNLGLPLTVCLQRQGLDQIVRVVGCRLHRPLARRQLRCRGFEHRGVHAGSEVPRQQRFEERRGIWLKRVQSARQLGLLDVFHDHRSHPAGLGRLRQHRFELGEDDVQLVNACTVLAAAEHECIDKRRSDLGGVLVFGLLREASPRLSDVPVAESVVIQRFTADHVQYRRFAFRPQQRKQLLGAAEDVGVVRATQSTVGGHHQHAGALGCSALDEQWMVESGLGSQGREHPGDLDGVGPGGLQAGLRPGDTRRRDQLLGLGDLLDRAR
ncbi:5'-3' exonuclease [Mycobacterium haemophilum DSM 44634]